jgi:hypothetical protein
MEKTHIHNATLNKAGKYYQHFGINEMSACLYGDDPKDIVKVKFKISEDQSVPNHDPKSLSADYWGWWDNEKKIFTLIYAKRFLLDMCFPNINISEERGHGKAYRLEIVEIL